MKAGDHWCPEAPVRGPVDMDSVVLPTVADPVRGWWLGNSFWSLTSEAQGLVTLMFHCGVPATVSGAEGISLGRP